MARRKVSLQASPEQKQLSLELNDCFGSLKCKGTEAAISSVSSAPLPSTALASGSGSLTKTQKDDAQVSMSALSRVSSHCISLVSASDARVPHLPKCIQQICSTQVMLRRDVVDEAVWRSHLLDLQAGLVLTGLYSLPNATFSATYRGKVGKERYGRSSITQKQRDLCRRETLAVVRCACAATMHLKPGSSAVLEMPAKSTSQNLSPLDLDEFQQVLKHPRVLQFTLDQCMYGSVYRAPVQLVLINILNAESIMKSEVLKCKHECCEWIFPSSGKRLSMVHPHVKGSEVPVRLSEWNAPNFQNTARQSVTEYLLEYPLQLQLLLARLLATPQSLASSSSSSAKDIPEMPSYSRIASDCESPSIAYMAPSVSPVSLTGSTNVKQSKVINAPYVGGLRRLATSLCKLSYSAEVGARINVGLSLLLDSEPSLVDKVLHHIGSDVTTYIDPEICKMAEKVIRAVLEPLVPSFVASVPTEDCRINHRLLELWQCAAKDPDWAVVQWLLHGAPAGIEQDIPSCGIFPEYKGEVDQAEFTAADLQTPPEFVNYEGVEESQDAAEELERLVGAGFVHCAQSIQEAREFLNGQDPVLSKIGLIIRTRAGKRKVRMVVDSKQSKVARASKKWQQMHLPTIRHALWDMLELLGTWWPT